MAKLVAMKLAALMIVLSAGVYLKLCEACDECPGYEPPKPPKAPIIKPPLPPKVPITPLPPKVPIPPLPPKAPKKPPLPPKAPTCPVLLVELGVCSPLLGGIVGGLLPASNDCCALLNTLGLDVEVCLCLAIDANILGLVALKAKVDAVASILTSCGYKLPPHFSCPHKK